MAKAIVERIKNEGLMVDSGVVGFQESNNVKFFNENNYKKVFSGQKRNFIPESGSLASIYLESSVDSDKSMAIKSGFLGTGLILSAAYMYQFVYLPVSIFLATGKYLFFSAVLGGLGATLLGISLFYAAKFAYKKYVAKE